MYYEYSAHIEGRTLKIDCALYTATIASPKEPNKLSRTVTYQFFLDRSMLLLGLCEIGLERLLIGLGRLHLLLRGRSRFRFSGHLVGEFAGTGETLDNAND
jgi:hypothetical protein